MSAPPKSRAARRDATQAALLDATIACLIEEGYAAMTTRGVAERAGVSQGAQQHHYRTKAELVDAAVLRLAEQIAAEIVAHPPEAEDERERVALLVDSMWAYHSSPLMLAILEFVTAARTDPSIAASVSDLMERGTDVAFSIAEQVVPHLAVAPGAREWLQITMATMRGAVLVTAVPGLTTVMPDWPALRAHILSTLPGR